MEPREPVPQKFDDEPEHTPNRAERRRRQKVASMVIPDALDTRRPGWDRRLLSVIDKVFVNGFEISKCVAYSVKDGWALQQGSPLKTFGQVTITRKPLA